MDFMKYKYIGGMKIDSNSWKMLKKSIEKFIEIVLFKKTIYIW